MILLSTRYSNYKPYTCKLELNGIQCEMQLDTGYSSTLISKKQFDLLPYAKLSKKRSILSLRDLFRWGHYTIWSCYPEDQIPGQNV